MGSKVGRFAVGVIVFGLVLPPALASADLPRDVATKSATKDDVDGARAAFQEGVKLYQGADYLGAREKFAEAERLHHASVIVYNLALTEERLGHVQAAVDGYERYIADEGEKGEFSTPAAIASAQLKARSAKIRVESDPSGLRIYVDGSPVEERTPTQILLAAGSHHVVVEGEGIREERDVRAVSGKSETVTFTRTEKSPVGDRPPPPKVPDLPKLAPVVVGPGPEGFVFGAHFVAVPYAFFKADTGPQDATATGASIGLSVEGGYAFTKRAEILVRALAAVGSECGSFVGSNFLSVGPAVSVRVVDWAWLGVSLLGGQAQACNKERNLATNIVFSPTFDIGFAVATQPYGQWMITACVGYYFANPDNDNRVLYAPVGFGLRFF